MMKVQKYGVLVLFPSRLNKIQKKRRLGERRRVELLLLSSALSLHMNSSDVQLTLIPAHSHKHTHAFFYYYYISPVYSKPDCRKEDRKKNPKPFPFFPLSKTRKMHGIIYVSQRGLDERLSNRLLSNRNGKTHYYWLLVGFHWQASQCVVTPQFILKYTRQAWFSSM